MVGVTDVEPTEEATRKLCQQIANMHGTFWGEYFVVSADKEEQQVMQYGVLGCSRFLYRFQPRVSP